MVESVVIAIIAVILSGIGITVGFFYNAHSIQQNTKTRYYQISKDLLDRFQEIENISDKKSIEYKSKINNFAFFMILLIKRKILPKEYIFPEYNYIFQNALWVINRESPTIKANLGAVIDFCQKNKIPEEKP